MKTYLLPLLILVVCLYFPNSAASQQIDDKTPNGTEGEFFPAKDSSLPGKKKKAFNEFDLHFTTLRIGAGLLYEYAAYAQDRESKQQADSGGYNLTPAFKVRDFRILVGGKFNTKRTITWRAGFMYDGASNSWFVRESGVMIAVPELHGNLFIGRTKEGFSLNKVMNGYAGWTMERQMAIDVIPILADGIKWMCYLPKQNILWNAGVYTDWLSHSQSFSTYKWQAAARIAWLPIHSPSENTVLHLGLNFRIGDPVNGQIRLRSRPEANPAPYFIDTGTFPTEQSTHFGWEAYYTKGPFMVGTEYYLHKFYSTEEKNPLFRGGDIMMSYVFTGESRPYTTVSGIYSFVPVKRSVFKGGIGAIEAVLRYSQLDLNDALITGGKFWRITPMINWYLSPIIRWEFVYGYGILDRYNLKGTTQFFQSRIQIVIL